MDLKHINEKIIIIDFGSQVTKLIARRVRELGVFSEIITVNELNKIDDFTNISGIILSGGPSTVINKRFPRIQKKIFVKKYQYWEYVMDYSLLQSYLVDL